MTNDEWYDVLRLYSELWSQAEPPSPRESALYYSMLKVNSVEQVTRAMRGYRKLEPDDRRPRRLWKYILDQVSAEAPPDTPLRNEHGHTGWEIANIVRALRASRHEPTREFCQAYKDDERLYQEWLSRLPGGTRGPIRSARAEVVAVREPNPPGQIPLISDP